MVLLGRVLQASGGSSGGSEPPSACPPLLKLMHHKVEANEKRSETRVAASPGVRVGRGGRGLGSCAPACWGLLSPRGPHVSFPRARRPRTLLPRAAFAVSEPLPLGVCGCPAGGCRPHRACLRRRWASLTLERALSPVLPCLCNTNRRAFKINRTSETEVCCVSPRTRAVHTNAGLPAVVPPLSSPSRGSGCWVPVFVSREGQGKAGLEPGWRGAERPLCPVLAGSAA